MKVSLQEIKRMQELAGIKPLNEQKYDLFEKPELMPQELKDVFEDNQDMLEDELSASQIKSLLSKVQKVGYTFDYGLDYEPFGLRPKGVKLEDLEGY